MTTSSRLVVLAAGSIVIHCTAHVESGDTLTFRHFDILTLGHASTLTTRSMMSLSRLLHKQRSH